MKRTTTTPAAGATVMMREAYQEIEESFERFCLKAGLATLTQMLETDASALCGPRHGRSPDRAGHRWGRTRGKFEFHSGRVDAERPRVRSHGGGGEVPLASWDAAESEDWLGRWVMNPMLINVSTRKFGRAVRLPEGDVPASMGDVDGF
jgi:putative transposase